jgi:hypothetical protein
MNNSPSAGDPLPANCELIEVHVSELKQLFNAIDPSPFRERDLDPNAEEFIADWAREASPSATLGLAVHLDRPAGLPNEATELREAIHEFLPSPRGTLETPVAGALSPGSDEFGHWRLRTRCLVGGWKSGRALLQ